MANEVENVEPKVENKKWETKNVVVNSLIVPGEFLVWEVTGPNPENYVCDAPADPGDLKELLEDLQAGKQSLISDFVKNPTDMDSFRKKAASAKLVRDDDAAMKKAAAEQKAKEADTKIEAIFALRDKVRTAAEEMQFSNAIFDFLLADRRKAKKANPS